jgi:hypothetical protein
MTIADLPAPVPPAVAGEVLAAGTPSDARDERLDTGAAALSGGGARSIFLHERFLVAVAGALMTGGIMAILLGWHGASGSVLVTEQVPYLISGGVLGLALATIGALTFFTHWLAVLVRDNRRQHEDLVRVLQEERRRDRETLLEAISELRPQAPVRRSSK